MITLSKKKPGHTFYNQGSQLAYVINGEENKTLKLVRGKTYTFEVNTPGHPFYFSRSSVGKGENSLMGSNEKVTDQGRMSFTVREDLPNEFYYQCQIHPKMGNKVVVIDINTVKKIACHLLI